MVGEDVVVVESAEEGLAVVVGFEAATCPAESTNDPEAADPDAVGIFSTYAPIAEAGLDGISSAGAAGANKKAARATIDVPPNAVNLMINSKRTV